MSLHLMQASLQFSDPANVRERDLHTIYGRGADVIGHTEGADQYTLIRRVAHAHGYGVVQPRDPHTGRRISTPISVRRGGRARLMGADYIPLVPGEPGPAREGGHGPRGLTVASLFYEGNRVAVSEFHTLTGWGGKMDGRDRAILGMWEDTLRVATAFGRGASLSVLMGDVNYDPDDKSPNVPSRLLDHYGWTSAYEEVGRPDLPTHGRRTIDQVYTLDRDHRLSVARVKRWPDTTGIDHQQVSVWLDVRPLKVVQ